MHRQHRFDACRKQAIEIMNASPHGLAAVTGMYYTEMFQWVYRRLEQGTAPAGIPAMLLEEWKAAGEWGRRKGK